MSKRFILISFPILLLAGIYFLGPEPDRPIWDKTMPIVPRDPDALEAFIAANESKHHVKPDNEARIVWADSSRKKTEYSVIYLHGFAASQGEGSPIHREFAKKFGCNLYLARLADHGIDTTEELLYYTPDRMWATAKEALAIGRAIGEKVIILSTSTGGTAALILAAEYPSDVHALLNLSPNIAVFHPLGFLANDPWGLQLARIVQHGKYLPPKYKPGWDKAMIDRYWSENVRLEAVSQLEEMLEDKMTPQTFEGVKQPSLSLYYYKNEAEQDSTVRVSAILEMNNQLGTPDSLKSAIAIPGAGDHVIGCSMRSGAIPEVRQAVEQFAMEKLHLKKVD